MGLSARQAMVDSRRSGGESGRKTTPSCGEPELFRGPGKAQCLGDGDEIPQVAKFHFEKFCARHSQKLSSMFAPEALISERQCGGRGGA